MERILLAILLLAPATGFAGIEFESTFLRIDANPGDSEATAIFHFTNTGRNRAKIERVESSCGCLKAESNQRIFEPGESGTIEAVFSTRGKTGLFEKTVTVQTNALLRSSHTLKVHVYAPGFMEIQPNMTTWKIGEDPQPKRVSFKVLGTRPIHIQGIESNRDHVRVTVETIVPGKHYELVLAPQHTKEATLGVIKIDTDCHVRAQRRQMAFFRIDS